MFASQTHAQTPSSISGVVYEDVNGDSQLNDGAPRPNVNVRVYADTNNDNVLNTGDAHIADTATDDDGRYTIIVTPGTNGNHYFVAVDSRSITPSSAASSTGFNDTFTVEDVWAEQTYGDDWTQPTLALDTRFGGRDVETSGADHSDRYTLTPTSFTEIPYRHLAFVDVTNGSIANLDWGFSFNVVTNMRAGTADDDDTAANRTVQGSFRQFLQNANAVAGPNVMRFVPVVGVTRDDYWAVDVSTVLPPLTDNDTTLDGTAYQATDGVTVRDQNPGQLGAESKVGVDQDLLQQVSKPEFEVKGVRNTAVVDIGLDVQGSNTIIRGLAIYGFGSSPNSSTSANIRVGDAANGVVIENNIIGTSAANFAAPEPASSRSGGDNLYLNGSGTLQHNLIGFAAGNGLTIPGDISGWYLEGNEVRGNDGSGARVNLNTIMVFCLVSNNGNTGITALGGVLEQNTIENNGFTGAESDAGVLLDGAYSYVQQNVIRANHGAGIVVQANVNDAFISRNSISANGSTGQLGIDLLADTDDQWRGSAPFVTRNDVNDADVGGNNLLNTPVLGRATVDDGTLTITGFAAPYTQIELYVAAPNASGFGEGETYLFTLEEGSFGDTDATTGSYNGKINGIDQGSDTTNRFEFSVPAPAGVATGTKLTATVTELVSYSTSEFSGLVTVNATPTAITLTTFTATMHPDRVALHWETGTELHTAGFHVWRSTTAKREDATRATTELIAAKGEGARGAAYQWEDASVEAGVAYTYWLEEVETGGAATMHGPARAGVGEQRIFLPLAR